MTQRRSRKPAWPALLRQIGVRSHRLRFQTKLGHAVPESLFATVKTELVYTRRFATRSEAREAVFEFVEVFYNRRRRHSSLGYMSPIDLEMKFIEERMNREYEAA